MFKEDRDTYRFKWHDLGNIAEGRPNLGQTTSVAVYRLMEYTLRDMLIARFNVQTANEILLAAGKMAGAEFCRNLLDTTLDVNGFLAALQDKLKELNIGILRIEKMDMASLEFIMTVSEDLDCSGLPVTDETVCHYDEGFFAGIFNVYTGREFAAREIDCWSTGERTCRFVVKPADKADG